MVITTSPDTLATSLVGTRGSHNLIMNNNTLQITSRKCSLEVEINDLGPSASARACRDFGQLPSVVGALDMNGRYDTSNVGRRGYHDHFANPVMLCTSDCTARAEIKTPPSTSLLPIADLFGALKMGGATVGANCGQHVNVDARDLSFNDVKRLAKIWATYERSIFQLVPTSRHGNGYCEYSVSGNIALGEIYASISRCASMNELHRVMNVNRTSMNLVNAQSGNQEQRVEFRLHSATLNVTKIGRFMKLCCELVDACKRIDLVSDDMALTNVSTFDDGIDASHLTTQSIFTFAEMFTTLHQAPSVINQTPSADNGNATIATRRVIAHNRIDGVDIAETFTRRGLLWSAFDSYCESHDFEANQIRAWRSSRMANAMVIECNENRRYIMAQISDWRTTRVDASNERTEFCADLVSELQLRATQLQSA